MSKVIGGFGERLLARILGETRAGAQTCFYERCGARHSRYCCYAGTTKVCGPCRYRP